MMNKFKEKMNISFAKIISGIFGFLVLLIGATSLTACHGSKRIVDFEMPEEFDTSKQIDIVFWAKNDNNARQKEIYYNAVEEFEKLYPNVSVTIKIYNDYSKIYNDVITNISTGTTPNICITYPDHIATYLTSQNQVLSLDDVMNDEKYGFGGSALLFDSPSRDELVEKYLEEGMIDGHYYALPYMRSSEALYINKTFVEALGYEVPDVVTWDFIFEVSEKAMALDADGNFAINGQNVMIPFIYKSTDNMMIQMMKQLNAGYSNSNGEVFLFNDEARKILKDLSYYGANRSFSTFKISSYPGNFLNAGQCIFAVDSTAGSTWIGADAPLSDICAEDIVEDVDIIVRPVPQYDTDNISMISQGPSICIFNKADSQETLASWMFAQFLLTNDIQIVYAQTEGYVPVTFKAQRTAEYQDYLSRSGEDNDKYYYVKLDATNLILNHIDDTFVTPVFNGSASVRDAAGQLIENAVKSGRRGEVVNDAYIDKLYDDIEALYRLDQLGASTKGTSGGSKDLGPLPAGAKALLITVGIVWCLILLYLGWGYLKNKKKNK